MAVLRSPRLLQAGAALAVSAEVEREAGRLALLIAERASAADDPDCAAGEVLASLVEALRASGGAIYRRRGSQARTRPLLEIVAGLRAEPPRAQGLAAAAARAVADGHPLEVPPPADALPGERIVALPLGGNTVLGALALTWPDEHGADKANRWVSLLIRLAPVLLLTTRRALRPDRGAGRARKALASERSADLLSLMSHELRTPLNTMNGFVEIVLDGLAGPLNDRQHEFLGYAHASTRHLIRLIEDMLLLHHAESGRALLRRKSVAVPAVAGKAIAIAREWGAVRDIKVALVCTSDLPPLVADEARLAQGLGNMVCFLVERAPAGSTIQLGVSAGEGWMTFVAEDGGPCLTTTELERLFEPLRPRLGATAAAATGLELPIARLIAEQHGGSLVASSGPESGLALRMSIPLDDRALHGSTASIVSSASRREGRGPEG